MNNEDEFYLTLLSNSSANYFPGNTTAKFATQLHRSIRLTDRWVVGLVEVQYPCSFLPVSELDNLIYYRSKTTTEGANDDDDVEKVKTLLENAHNAFKNPNVELYYGKGGWIVVRISAGDYENIEDIITAINDQPKVGRLLHFEYNKVTKRVSATLSDLVVVMGFSQKLALQLGYKPNVNLATNLIPSHPANIWVGLPSQMFIYCDLVEPQLVGDVLAPLVRIVNITSDNYNYGSHKDVIFSPAHYIPVMRKEFENLEIDIRTDTGDAMPFEFGTLSVKLHFKKIKE